ncbi:hypothetical protein EBR56_01990 [bacterium]|nr:hypothetical protein [bacterium]
MATAAFSIPDDSHRRISLRRRGRTPTTATAAAADEAIRQVVELRRRRHRYGEDPEPKPSLLGEALGTVTAPVRESIERLGLGRWAFAALVLGVVGITLVVGVCTLSGGPSCVVHPAAGIARAGHVPLVGAQIRLHPRGMTLPDDATPSATVQDDGTFAFTTFEKGDGAPAGDYVATVQWFRLGPDGGAGGNELPKRYASPTTSPLTVTIREGTNDLPPFTFHR